MDDLWSIHLVYPFQFIWLPIHSRRRTLGNPGTYVFKFCIQFFNWLHAWEISSITFPKMTLGSKGRFRPMEPKKALSIFLHRHQNCWMLYHYFCIRCTIYCTKRDCYYYTIQIYYSNSTNSVVIVSNLCKILWLPCTV